MSVLVKFYRPKVGPGVPELSWDCHDDQLCISMREDLITEEGARVMRDLLSQVLTDHWRPRQPLKLIQGEG